MNKLVGENAFLKNFYYVTETGDTLLSIADKFHTTARVIAVDNNLEKEIVKGQLLFVRQIDGEEYIIKVGDTLKSISKNDEVLLNRIMVKNLIETIYVGQKIII